MGRKKEDLGSIPGKVKRFSSLRSVQMGSEAHPVSYPRSTWGFFPGGSCGRGVNLITHLHLVRR